MILLGELPFCTLSLPSLPPTLFCIHISYYFDWCCFYYFLRNSLVALLEALFARLCVNLYSKLTSHTIMRCFEALDAFPFQFFLQQLVTSTFLAWRTDPTVAKILEKRKSSSFLCGCSATFQTTTRVITAWIALVVLSNFTRVRQTNWWSLTMSSDYRTSIANGLSIQGLPMLGVVYSASSI